MDERYSRQIIFSKIGEEGQKKLRDASVAIVGVGGLGTIAAELLVRAGIGSVSLIDRDVVELSNLQRQVLFNTDDIGKSKVHQAKEKLERINPEVQITVRNIDLTFENISAVGSGMILDCTDNLETRFLINEYCKENGFPWVYASVVGDKGFVKLFTKDEACFNCIFKQSDGLDTCDTEGVINTAVSMVASVQVTEAIKFIIGESVSSDMKHIDAWNGSIEHIKVKRDDSCGVCGGDYAHLFGEHHRDIIKFCGSGSFQISHSSDLKKLRERLSKLDDVEDLGYAIKFKSMTIFRDRALIKAKDEKAAKSLFAKYVGA